MSDSYQRSVIVPEQLRGTVGIVDKGLVETQDDLSITPKIWDRDGLPRQPKFDYIDY